MEPHGMAGLVQFILELGAFVSGLVEISLQLYDLTFLVIKLLFFDHLVLIDLLLLPVLIVELQVMLLLVPPLLLFLGAQLHVMDLLVMLLGQFLHLLVMVGCHSVDLPLHPLQLSHCHVPFS